MIETLAFLPNTSSSSVVAAHDGNAKSVRHFYLAVAIKILVATIIASLVFPSFAQSCPSSATININSSNYSGAFNVELRKGNRPGSKVVGKRAMQGTGSASFDGICPGTYFFAFGTVDSDQVSTTRYFAIKNDGNTYNSPEITVTYTRHSQDGSQRVGSAKRTDL